MAILFALFGLAYAVALTAFIMISVVKKATDWGDSSIDILDVSDGLEVDSRADNVKPKAYFE